jgi:hypothetical protein
LWNKNEYKIFLSHLFILIPFYKVCPWVQTGVH